MTEAKQLLEQVPSSELIQAYRKEHCAMNTCYPPKKYTLNEFESMPKQDGFDYELIDGIIMMSPRPSVIHQRVSGNLYFELRKQLQNGNCDVIQDIDLVLENNNLVPDLMISCDEKFEGKRHEKPPTIVIEIVSPSSSSRDFIVKLQKYKELSIPEYWIVVPEERCVWVISFTQNSQNHYTFGQAVSSVLPELAIELETIFE